MAFTIVKFLDEKILGQKISYLKFWQLCPKVCTVYIFTTTMLTSWLDLHFDSLLVNRNLWLESPVR